MIVALVRAMASGLRIDLKREQLLSSAERESLADLLFWKMLGDPTEEESENEINRRKPR